MKRKLEDEDPVSAPAEEQEPYARKVGGKVTSSNLLRPAQTIGVVTERGPFAHTKMGGANFVPVSVGRSFEVYDADYLRKTYLGPPLNAPIRALLCVGDVTVTALKHDIVCWHKSEEVVRL